MPTTPSNHPANTSTTTSTKPTSQIEKDAKQTAKDAQNTVETAADRIEREAGAASAKAKEAVDSIKEEAKSRVDDAKQAFRGAAEEQKNAAATHIHEFARAIRTASEELSQRDQSFAARLVKEAADGLEKVSSSVSGATADDMVHSVSRFARSNPGAFLTGAVLAGVALGRFAKASGERDHTDTESQPQYRPGGPASAPPYRAATASPTAASGSATGRSSPSNPSMSASKATGAPTKSS
jgi:hypothetical protein